MAACHFWQELEGDVAAEEIFDATAMDEVPAVDLAADADTTTDASQPDGGIR